MSTAILQIDIDAAQRRAERIRFHATNANDAMQSLQKLVHTARELEDHLTLGYPSWTAYVREIFGDEPLRLARDVRRELVAELADAGMSTRAIAPIVGVGLGTVHRDIEASRVPNGTPDPTETLANLPDKFEIDGMTVTSRGEVIDSQPEVTEHTFTEKVKTVTGLDGKEYKRPESRQRENPPILTGQAAEQDNADTACREIGKALLTFDAFDTSAHRIRVLTKWWPMGKNNIQPMHAALFTTKNLRRIAAAMATLADEMDKSNA